MTQQDPQNLHAEPGFARVAGESAEYQKRSHEDAGAEGGTEPYYGMTSQQGLSASVERARGGCAAPRTSGTAEPSRPRRFGADAPSGPRRSRSRPDSLRLPYALSLAFWAGSRVLSHSAIEEAGVCSGVGFAATCARAASSSSTSSRGRP